MEIWKPVVGYEWKYEVSNLWNIKSLQRKITNQYWLFTTKERILKPSKNKLWHCHININKKKFYIHRLVAQAFIPNPDKKVFVCHKDEHLFNWMLDNSVNNLWWGTPKENMQDMIRKWRDRCCFKIRHPMKWKYWKHSIHSKPIIQYSLSWSFIKEWECARAPERELWISHSYISRCCLLKQESAWWFIWKFK